MRIAALDLGSNSFHLLIADVHPDGTFEAVTREKDMLRLGDEVARDGGRISAPTAERAIASVGRMRQLADALGAEIRPSRATSSPRRSMSFSRVTASNVPSGCTSATRRWKELEPRSSAAMRMCRGA
jgi:hypothetical protein